MTGSEIKDIIWFQPDGIHIPDDGWENNFAKSFGVFLNGKGIRCVDWDGERIIDDHFLLLFNTSENALEFTLPAVECDDEWHIVLDSSEGFINKKEEKFKAGNSLTIQSRAIMILQCQVD